ncbi:MULTISPECIES: sigma-70 family RNA polymerase sigma factor [unclassified Parabacteroides]|uniref:RNA polymerase sigma factor n=1 Tax=unclassified Parabacteroides TaxID=2649774 RepID=UPI002474AC6B|nr:MULTISPECIES: sigma-70 family RNA polymerase sigma factor [unclassified Parabacteroides]
MELDAFKETVVSLRERLLHISLRLIENEADAEDVVQEVFLKLWQMRDALDQYRSVEALAVTMTKNLTLDKIKLRKPQGDEQDLLRIETETRNPALLLEQQDAVACIRRLIEQLPTLQQTIIRMKDVEGYELAEIAAITGTQIEAVRSNLSRARKKVREHYLAIHTYNHYENR